MLGYFLFKFKKKMHIIIQDNKYYKILNQVWLTLVQAQPKLSSS